jgi:quercetin 2,3-dioxygenase
VHQEFHSPAFARRGGMFEMVQLWVNLPSEHKLMPPRYQTIEESRIPEIELVSGAGRIRVIAGAFDGVAGPAATHSPLNVWDLTIEAERQVELEAPEGHTTIVVVLSGALEFDGGARVEEAQAALLSREGAGAQLFAPQSARALVLTGAPLGEPIFGRGPFVMNSEAEIRQAFQDFGAGRFGAIARR